MTVEKDTVILHMFERARNCPNPSPYPIKLETFMRMAGIKYEADFAKPMSAKGKSPWMTLNGEDVADSQLCIEHLQKHFGEKADLSRHLSAKERAEARAMRAVLEDHLYFCFVMEKWIFGKRSDILKNMAPLPGPGFLHNFILGRVAGNLKKQCEGQGIGRHSPEQIRAMAKEDLKTISDYLGEKPFMMGDQPTEIDCVVFGFTTPIFYTVKEGDKDALLKYVEEECANLKAHNDRIKEKYYSDWEELKWKPKE